MQQTLTTTNFQPSYFTVGEPESSPIFAHCFITMALSSTLIATPIAPGSPIYASVTSEIHKPAEAAGLQITLDSSKFQMIRRIRDLGEYKDGWAGEQTIGPSKKASDDAERFAWSLDLSNAYSPFISPGKDGEINFWWNNNGEWVDLGMFGDGTYSYYAKLPNGQEYIADSVPVSQALPIEILEAIKIS